MRSACFGDADGSPALRVATVASSMTLGPWLTIRRPDARVASNVVPLKRLKETISFMHE
jgi:hypothetical protein